MILSGIFLPRDEIGAGGSQPPLRKESPPGVDNLPNFRECTRPGTFLCAGMVCPMIAEYVNYPYCWTTNLVKMGEVRTKPKSMDNHRNCR